jgi:hypothetical protein
MDRPIEATASMGDIAQNALADTAVIAPPIHNIRTYIFLVFASCSQLTGVIG